MCVLSKEGLKFVKTTFLLGIDSIRIAMFNE